MQIETFLLDMPKVELHIHLEGTFRPATLLQLAKKNRVSLPVTDEAGIRQWLRFRDFRHFIETYVTCSSTLRDPEDFQLLARDFLEEQARQSIVYSEVHFTISTHLANGANGEEVLAALSETAGEAAKAYGVRMALIPDIVRNMERARADKTLRWAVDGKSRGVIALGISGMEKGYSNEPFAGYFREASQEGLHCVAHAGESDGPDSIRSALEHCLAERIGHGIGAVEDPVLIETLAADRIPLEVCPSSNVVLGNTPSLEEHPIAKLHEAGIPISVNSDDPPFFDTTLTGEYLNLNRCFGWGAPELAALSMAALRQSFLDPEAKAEMETDFRSRFAALGVNSDECSPW